jgi:(1->4)-alpha-D-glucan 1-alpha-D-glucosylmutase
MRHPTATYRVQLNARFRFADALTIVPYLHALGISDLYTSPFLRAQPGSVHGYDVTDHRQLNPEIGTEAELEQLVSALTERGMGLVMDIVPNHMGIGDPSNQWWQSVLQHGPSSPTAPYFDIDWTPPKETLVNQVLLPVLGDQFGKALESGQLQLTYERGTFVIAYYERRFPVAPHTWGVVLEPLRHQAARLLPSEEPAMIELESILTALKHLPTWTDTNPDTVRERQRESDVVRRRLDTLVEGSPAIAEALQKVMAAINGRPDDPRSFDRLEGLLAQQPYRLCYWRVASDEINYRRFFDVSELAAIRVELPEVFDAVHARAFDLLARGVVTGLRIDHPDGLLDPEQYFRDLETGSRRALGAAETGNGAGPIVVAEKILSPDEQLPPRWAVHGTTGYDFLNVLNGLFVDPVGAEPLHTLYEELTGQRPDIDDVVYASKRLILQSLMLSELHVLARRLDRISEQHRWSRDYTLVSIEHALAEVIACFPVYRTYIRAPLGQISEDDRRHVQAAIRGAKRRNPAVGESIFDWIGSVLLLEDPDGLGDAERAERRNFVMRLQQITGSVMAKGMEDTAFYRAYPLLSLNEVGGDPERFGVSVEEFHRRAAQRLAPWGASLLATSTHDTKRSEDVRARINVLSEIPEDWGRAVVRWRAKNRRHLAEFDGAPAPDANEEYLLYQTLVGCWPLTPMDAAEHEAFIVRIEAYMEKALKEAKVHTSWVRPNADYDRAVKGFVRTILAPGRGNAFLRDFRRFHALIARVGMVNSLAQVVLKVASPGVTDVYQGTELWDFSLVDPDNRRPVDFARRARAVAHGPRARAHDAAEAVRRLLEQWPTGEVKLWTLRAGLQARRQRPELYLRGEYLPLRTGGAHGARVCAFARHDARDWALAVVPRLCAPLARRSSPLGLAWQDTWVELPSAAPARWRHELTGDVVEASSSGGAALLPIQRLLRDLPVALLTAEV